ncbi:hypothetical protein THAOC_13988 [Thalassiosira oceanica]|uniref:Uncharacterized protein n=1 Tax=Thalassiosira oceanica TaxID=159749 RepID=K0SIT2_THAOC|nr:hypothetical protein THAOC_13988 [Thalassiosira oceanica]|eukprot:EJK65185.1 hypothetical protein THAOC_13988 [Thalassiosira oceanica]
MQSHDSNTFRASRVCLGRTARPFLPPPSPRDRPLPAAGRGLGAASPGGRRRRVGGPAVPHPLDGPVPVGDDPGGPGAEVDGHVLEWRESAPGWGGENRTEAHGEISVHGEM